LSSPLKIIRSRLNLETVSQITDSPKSDIYIEHSVSSDVLVIKGADISHLEIKQSKFKYALSFIECEIHGSISLLTNTFLGGLTFTKCHISGDFNVYHAKFDDKTLHIIHSEITGTVQFDGVDAQCIEFDAVTAKKIEIISTDSKSTITKILVYSSNIDISAKLFNIDHIQAIEFKDTSVPSLTLKNLNNDGDANWLITDSKIDDFYLENNQLFCNSSLDIEKCTFTNLGLNNCKYTDCEVKISNSLINGVLSLTGVEQSNTHFDFSTSYPVNLKLDQSLTEFIATGEKESPLLAISGNRQQRIGTLKILKSMFANDNDYVSEDRSFYILNNVEAKDRLSNMRVLMKIPNYLYYLVGRYIFGWGVKIKNPIISIAIFIVGGSVYNYFSLNLNNPNNAIEYVGQRIGGFYAALVLNILSFFGQQADATLPSGIPPYVFMSEFILGMIMVTLVVGILIRKLVR